MSEHEKAEEMALPNNEAAPDGLAKQVSKNWQGRVPQEMWTALEAARSNRKFAEFVRQMFSFYQQGQAAQEVPAQFIAIQSAVEMILREAGSFSEAMRAVVKDKNESIDHSNKSIVELMEQLSEQETQVSDLQRQIEEQAKELARVESEAIKAKDEAAKEVARLKAVEETIGDMRQSVKDSNQAKEAAQAIAQTSKEDVEVVNRAKAVLEAEIKASIKEIERLSGELAECRIDNKQLAAQLASESAEKNRLTGENAAIQKALDRLTLLNGQGQSDSVRKGKPNG